MYFKIDENCHSLSFSNMSHDFLMTSQKNNSYSAGAASHKQELLEQTIFLNNLNFNRSTIPQSNTHAHSKYIKNQFFENRFAQTHKF